MRIGSRQGEGDVWGQGRRDWVRHYGLKVGR
jgi:hypothetical protein